MENKCLLILLLTYCTILSGCSGTAQSQIQPKPSGLLSDGIQTVELVSKNEASENPKFIVKKQKTKYLLSNGIELKQDDIILPTAYGELNLQLPQISGLADKKLEDKINQAINTDIKGDIKASDMGPMYNNPYTYYCNTLLSVNNLISFSVSKLYASPQLGYLYRLTDGKRLSLKDIFTEGTDYVYLLNQKINEEMIGKEEDLLYQPFSTIKPDQAFALSPSTLFIIFKAGEGGFVNDSAVSIPLSKIDDYVNVMDIYSGTERKNHLKSELFLRNNNIFLTPKGEIISRKNGKLWTYFPKVSGLRDDQFEKSINSKLDAAVNEAIKDRFLDGLSATSEENGDWIAKIQLDTVFNHYGILSLRRNAYTNDDIIEDLASVYSFDLIKKKPLNAAAILDNYLKKNPEKSKMFTEMVCNELKNLLSRNTKYSTLKNINYPFIMNNAIIYFNNYFGINDIQISIYFKKGIKGIDDRAEFTIPLKSILDITPEEFFAQ